MIKRTRREHCLQTVKQNPDWRVLDLGCGKDGIRVANVYADVEDYASEYPEFEFIQTDAAQTPFKDKEFDFVFSNHIAEHVLDPLKFCSELVRISARGFIEVPLPFFDNFVIGNSNPPPHGHVWWVTYDDLKNEVVFKERKVVVEQQATTGDTTFLLPFFRESMILELYWENGIEARVDDAVFNYDAGNSNEPVEINCIDAHAVKLQPPPRHWRPKTL